MTLNRYFYLIAVVVVCGAIQVGWRTAIVMKSYRLGESANSVKEARQDLQWLKSEISALESPVYLAGVSAKRDLGLVASSSLLGLVEAYGVPADEARNQKSIDRFLHVASDRAGRD